MKSRARSATAGRDALLARIEADRPGVRQNLERAWGAYPEEAAHVWHLPCLTGTPLQTTLDEIRAATMVNLRPGIRNTLPLPSARESLPLGSHPTELTLDQNGRLVVELLQVLERSPARSLTPVVWRYPLNASARFHLVSKPATVEVYAGLIHAQEILQSILRRVFRLTNATLIARDGFVRPTRLSEDRALNVAARCGWVPYSCSNTDPSGKNGPETSRGRDDAGVPQPFDMTQAHHKAAWETPNRERGFLVTRTHPEGFQETAIVQLHFNSPVAGVTFPRQTSRLVTRYVMEELVDAVGPG